LEFHTNDSTLQKYGKCCRIQCCHVIISMLQNAAKNIEYGMKSNVNKTKVRCIYLKGKSKVHLLIDISK